ncbi:MAG: carbon monoxide dehydrogenase subunit G [Paracoccaceae bacterium]
MELKGSRTIAADRMAVWVALNEADVLRMSIPGCSELTGNAADGFEAVVTQKIGPVKATFKGQVELSDIVEGVSYKISGQGKGGPAGYANGGAVVTLEDSDGGTRLSYDVSAKVGGKLASLGARLIDGVARRLADQFFENFQAAVEGEPVEQEQPMPETEQPGFISKIMNWLKGLFS